jgi:hypothetical protein
MDQELKQHLEAMEGRIIANIDAKGGRIIASIDPTGEPINAHVNDSLAAYETNVVAAIIDLRDTLTRAVDKGFEQMNCRLDAQDRMLDRQDALIDESVRVMNDDIERMDKLLARRAS